MKKIKTLVLVATFVMSTSVYPQEKQEKNVVYTNVIPIIFLRYLNFHYERVLSNKITLLVGAGFWAGKVGLSLFGYTAEAEILITPLKFGFGFYPAGRPLRGFYFLPNVVLYYISAKNTEGWQTASFHTINVEFGHRWIWKDGYMFDLSIGIGIVSSPEGETESYYSGILPTHVGVQVGYAW